MIYNTLFGMKFIKKHTELLYRENIAEGMHFKYKFSLAILFITCLVEFIQRLVTHGEKVHIILIACKIAYLLAGLLLAKFFNAIESFFMLFYEVWSSIADFALPDESFDSSANYLSEGVLRTLICYINLSPCEVWQWKFLALMISIPLKFANLNSTGKELVSMSHRHIKIFLLLIAIGYYLYQKEKKARTKFGQNHMKYENLKGWRIISERITPTGYAVLSDLGCKETTSSTGIGSGLEVIYANDFFEKEFAVSEGQLLPFLRNLTLKDFHPQLELGSQLPTQIQTLLNFDKFEHLLIDIFQRQKSKTEGRKTGDSFVCSVLSKITAKEEVGGAEKEIEISIFEYVWDDLPCILLAFKDVNAHHLNEKLLQLNRHKDHLLSSVSHELKTPLNSIVGITSLLLGRETESEKTQLLNQVKVNSEYLIFKINDILDLSRCRTGDLGLIIDSFDINNLIEKIHSLFNLQFTEKNVKFLIDIKMMKHTLNTDFSRLNQILVNLISNALKFTFKGTVKLLVEDIGSHEVKITVMDTGVGMESEEIENLFQIYNKSEEFAKKDTCTHGVGLGLSISKLLVGFLGPEEKINVISERGVGSEFSFLIHRDLISDKGPRSKNRKITILKAYRERYRSEPQYPDQTKFSSKGQKETIFSNFDYVQEKKRAGPIKLKWDCFSLRKGTKKEVKFKSPFSSLDHFEKIFKLPDTSMNKGNNQDYAVVNSEENKDVPSEIHQWSQIRIVKNQSPSESKFLMELPIETLDLGNKKMRIRSYIGESNFMDASGKLTNSQRLLNILIVDDTPFNILIIENFIKSMSNIADRVNCVRAYNGEECLEIVMEFQKQKLSFDVIFMDCNMPVLDGYQATEKLKEMMKRGIIKNCPVLGISAYVDIKNKEKSLSSGMEDMIGKPLTKAMFENYFNKWVTKI